MKYILIIGDGMADSPIEALGGKTPLEYAAPACMNAMAAAGQVGRAETVPPGVEPGSDTAILSIFGYDPRRYYSGRSPLEAVGSGVSLRPGNLSFRVNLVALSPAEPYESRRMLSHNAGEIEGEEALAAMAALMGDSEFMDIAQGVGMSFTPTPSFRHVAVLETGEASAFRTDPPHDFLDQALAAHLPEGEGLLALQKRATLVLDNHPMNAARRAAKKLPANGIWFWGAGSAIMLPSFPERTGLQGVVVSAVPLVKGIARLAGLEAPEVPGATGRLDTDYAAKLRVGLAGLENGAAFLALHVEAPDECAHAGDLEGKLQAIGDLDDKLIVPLLEALRAAGESFRVLILSDHYTPLATRTHSAEPVPFLLYDSREKMGNGAAYGETVAEKGQLVPGDRILDALFTH